MSEIQSNIRVNIDTTSALESLKALQRQISVFQQEMGRSGAAAQMEASKLQQSLINGINGTGNFTASMTTVASTTEAFTTALEKNKLSMGEYFRYSLAASKSFGKAFSGEFDTIQQVAIDRVKEAQSQYIKLGNTANGAVQAIKIKPATLDMQDLGTKTQIAAQRQQILNQLLTQGSTNLLNWGKNTQWAGRQLMMGFTLPLVAFGQVAVKAFSTMEQSVVDFKRVYGDLNTSMAETNQMADQVQNLAMTFTKYGVQVADTMKLASEAAAMGKQGADLLAQIESATTLSVLGGVDQQKALETTISLTNAFGISADQLKGKINFLNAVENQTVTNIADLTVAIPKAAPVIKQLGGNVEDLTFFLTAMKEGGINAAEGANAIKSGLAAMINPTAAATKMLSGFGINIKQIVADDKGNIRKTVVDFATALDKLDPTNRAQAIEKMFGKFQFARISTLFKNIIDTNSQAYQVMKLADQGPAAAQILADRELKQIQNSPLYQYKKALAEVQAALIPIGKQFLQVLTPILGFVNGALNWFNGLNSGIKSVIGTLVIALGVIGPVVLMGIGLIGNGIANLIKLFANFKSFINNIGKDSKELGSQTAYMTETQLKAYSAASSLEQVHAKYKQTITATREALSLYNDELQRMVNIQGGYAREAQKVSTVSSQTVTPSSSSIGFGSIKVGDAKKASGLYKAPPIIQQQTAAMAWDSYEAEIAAINASLKNTPISQAQRENLLKKQASHIGEDSTMINANGTPVNVKNWKSSNLIADTGYVNNYLNSLGANSKILKNFEDSHIDTAAKNLGISIEEVQKELELFKKGIHPTTRRAAEVAQQIAMTDSGYQSKAFAAGMQARLSGNFYETISQRLYDPSKDISAEKTTRTRIQKFLSLIENSEKTIAIETEKQAIEAKEQTKSQSRSDAARKGWETRRLKAAEEAAIAEEEQAASSGAGLFGANRASKFGNSKFGKFMGSGAGMGVAMGASIGIDALSAVGGPVGQVAGALAPVANFASLGMMIGPEGALAGAALGGLVSVITLANNAYNDQIKAVTALTGSMVASNDKIIAMSKATGTVSAIEAQRANAAAVSAGFGKTTTAAEALAFGDKTLNTDIGKQILSDIDIQTKAGKTGTEIGKNLGTQFSTYIAQGVLTPDQAKSLAASIGVKLKDQSISAEITGQIKTLLGPDGKNLKDNPLTANMSIQAAVNQNTQDLYTKASQTKDYKDLIAANQANLTGYGASEQSLASLTSSDAYKNMSEKQKQDAQEQIAKARRDAISKLPTIRDSAVFDSQIKNSAAYASMSADEKAKMDSAISSIQDQGPSRGLSHALANAKDAKKKAALQEQYDTQSTYQNLLGAQLTSGALSPTALNSILASAKNNSGFMSAYTKAVGTAGDTGAINFVTGANQLGLSQQSTTTGLQNIGKDRGMLNLYNKIASLGGKDALEAIINVKVKKNDKDISTDQLKEDFTKIDNLFKSGKKVTYEQAIKSDIQGFSLAKNQQAWFDSLPAEQQKWAIDYMVSMKATVTDNDVRAWKLHKLENAGGGYHGDQTGSNSLVTITGDDMANYLSEITQKATSSHFSSPNNTNNNNNTGSPAAPAQTAAQKMADKYTAALNIIGREETAINKTYSDRISALDRIQQANDKINQQKRDQLTIADALSRGDIAAAAAAAQTAQANAQSSALAAQKQAMQDAQTAAINAITVGGLTKDQITARENAAANKTDYATLGGTKFKFSAGGMVPSYFAAGGYSKGTDIIPAMLTPGEFVIKKSSVDKIGTATLNAINNGESANGQESSTHVYGGDSVYNYSITVNAETNADAHEIANVVLDKIHRIESQQVRGSRF
jgi:TP901 family phage tail tape measure protein